ncbi:MAG: hypothetical protein AAGA43_02510 [Bacteroidota bacterium]
MMTSFRSKIQFYLICWLSLNVNAQFKNSEENEVGRIYNAETKAINFSGGETSFEIRVFKSEQDYDTRYSNQNSAKKKFAVFLKAGVTNSKEFIDIDEFDFKENNGLLLGANVRWSFDDVYILNNQSPFQYETFIASIQYSYDKFNLYNPNTQLITKETPQNLEIKFGWNHYFFLFKRRNAFERGTVIITSLNGSLNPLSYNSNDLSNFSEIDDDVIADGNVFSTRSFDGKFGVLNDGVETAELAFSIPILFDYVPKNMPYIFPIPYISAEYFSFDKPRWNFGVSVGFSSKPIFGERRNGTDAKTTGVRKFNNPSSLTLGVDWTQQGNQGSKPNFFITGNVGF